MDILARPPDWERVNEVLELFPEFEGDVPDEALYWSTGDLELFFGTQGQLKPLSVSGPSPKGACLLLSMLRRGLAEWSINKASCEYRSWCRHLAERQEHHRLYEVVDCTHVPRAKSAPQPLRAPVVLEDLERWRGRIWNLDFWCQECGEEEWPCRARSPVFEHDSEDCAECMYYTSSIAMFVEYVHVIQQADPSCDRDREIAFPRVVLDNWTPFVGPCWDLFAESWTDLSLPGVQDLTPRWMRMFGDALRSDWLEDLARFYTVTIGAAGSMTRLRTENHRAHAWFYQTEGTRLFFLFPPQDADKLYKESGGVVKDQLGGYAAGTSPVDIFYPSARRHPRFLEARSQVAVLKAGEALVVPGGWWQYSVALEASVTIRHVFWNLENRRHMVDELRDWVNWETLEADQAELYRYDIASVHAEVMKDEDSEMDE